MNQLRRRIYRFRAGIYARLPKNKSLFKGGILLMAALCLLLYYKVKTVFPELFGDADAIEVNADANGDVSDLDKMEDGEWQPPVVSESGYLSVEYVQGEVLPQVKPSGGQETSGGKVTPEVPELTGEPAKETSTGVLHSVTGLKPAYYPKLSDIIGVKYMQSNLNQLGYLKDTFYIVNPTTKMTEEDFSAERLLAADLTIPKKDEVQILIYHTHASEAFVDSRKGVEADTIVGMGDLLQNYLEKKYGYKVLHEKTVFDRKDGADNRSYAYNDALPYITRVLEEHPEIEVIIDLHRDAGAKRVATIQGKQVAKVMLFNGLCRNTKGKLDHLPNKNLQSNLAFSFQMKLMGDEMYPGLMNRIFLKDYRYNMHLAERYLLIELGTNNNTVEEVANAMEPLADVLAHVLGDV